MIRVRPAVGLDTRSMARLLNRIIEIGGTTAITRPVTAEDLGDWIAASPTQSSWQVAVDDKEEVAGFQWIAPNSKLPIGACDIATFVEVGRTGLGIGSALFEATSRSGRDLGYDWINATIRADNDGGLIYYQSRGFRDWKVERDIPLENGMPVDRISKRFDLD